MSGSRTLGLVTVLAAGLVIAGLAAGPAVWANPVGNGAGAALTQQVGGPFDLIDQTGRAVTDRDFLGRYMLVYFGYAKCPGICPTALRSIADAIDLLGDEGSQVAPILITVDAKNDQPENLAAAVAKIHPRLTGLTGTPEQLALAAAAYGVAAKQVTRSWDGIDIYEHGVFIYLMGPDGKLLTLFPPIIGADAMAEAIRGYLG